MRHDARLRAATQAIYEAVYPSDEWSPVGFDEAGRCGTIHYHQAVDAAQRARGALASTGEQFELVPILTERI